MYNTFLLPQQSFFNQISESKINCEEWGIKVEFDNNLSLKHIAKRMRNALAHNRIIISKEMDFIFWDAHPKIKEFSKAEAVYSFTFDSLMFLFIPKWKEAILDALKRINL